jgi:Zn-dependent protease
MFRTRRGSLWIFRFAGIDVYVNWLWFVMAVYQIQRRTGYSSLTWSIAEYLSLFALVLMHEFGHALACRSVGGQANEIVLWLLGGVAYVAPPQRPGAVLWSLAAGPLVNVVMAPVLVGLCVLGGSLGWDESAPNLRELSRHMMFINIGLLCFNMLPIYPLDGGQILRALLWYPLGRARSMIVATAIGFVGLAGLIGLAVWSRAEWAALICVFIFFNCGRGLLHGLELARIARAPRRQGLACPACHSAPPQGEFWTCSQCRKRFDFFATFAACPNCQAQFTSTRCLDCGDLSPMSGWMGGPVPPVANL